MPLPTHIPPKRRAAHERLLAVYDALAAAKRRRLHSYSRDQRELIAEATRSSDPAVAEALAAYFTEQAKFLRAAAARPRRPFVHTPELESEE